MDKLKNGTILSPHNWFKYHNSKYILCQNGSRLSQCTINCQLSAYIYLIP